MAQSAASALTEVASLSGTVYANPLYPTGAPQRCNEIIRGSVSLADRTTRPYRRHLPGDGEPAMIAAFRAVTTRITQLYWRPSTLAEDNGRMIIVSRGLQR